MFHFPEHQWVGVGMRKIGHDVCVVFLIHRLCNLLIGPDVHVWEAIPCTKSGKGVWLLKKRVLFWYAILNGILCTILFHLQEWSGVLNDFHRLLTFSRMSTFALVIMSVSQCLSNHEMWMHGSTTRVNERSEWSTQSVVDCYLVLTHGEYIHLTVAKWIIVVVSLFKTTRDEWS